MKKNLVLVMTLSATTIFFSACTNPLNQQSQDSQTAPTVQSDKQGDTKVTGKIILLNEKFFIEEAGKEPRGIDSYSIDLKQSIGKTVTITGQYSGDTLFVGKIE